ncbi:hypothetical protein XH97_30515 [Bradyrhizobium sp. CCBAU 53380]|nr:hypothetical protein [Bradyrhizobium sp. CCBAU 53380]
MDQPPPEKPWPNEPKPPRLTPWEPESDDDEWLEESPLKKLDRDDQRELLPPLEEPLLLLHAVLACAAASVPGGGGSQFCRGISV